MEHLWFLSFSRVVSWETHRWVVPSLSELPGFPPPRRSSGLSSLGVWSSRSLGTYCSCAATSRQAVLLDFKVWKWFLLVIETCCVARMKRERVGFQGRVFQAPCGTGARSLLVSWSVLPGQNIYQWIFYTTAKINAADGPGARNVIIIGLLSFCPKVS